MNDDTALLAAVERRRELIAVRLQELRTRRRLLAARGARGSTAADVAAAVRSAVAARRHAEEARNRAEQRQELSRRRHLRAAAVLAAAGDHEAAARHRAAADAERPREPAGRRQYEPRRVGIPTIPSSDE
ncbi:hypothetical protein [Pseudonocardia dioxanivorans]|uniref:hypothetical protein n=1 Tax=Pseudonocardia dioxanivorans TaxID=240495 RepID=UPI000CD215C4|nr:hypothetical protein [Pseudonocardia dioxanivorans]